MSPRTTTFIQMLLSAPTWTSPITCALTSTNAVGSTVGNTDLYGRSIGFDYRASYRTPDSQWDPQPTPNRTPNIGTPGSCGVGSCEFGATTSGASAPAVSGTCPSCQRMTSRRPRRFGRTGP